MARISRRALCARIVARLRQAAEHESNRQFWDDYCIAWMTVAKAAHGERSPHFWATYEHLGTAPEQVWPMILARRKNALGREYSAWYDLAGNLKPEGLPPKKQPESVRARAEEEKVWAETASARIATPRRHKIKSRPFDDGNSSARIP